MFKFTGILSHIAHCSEIYMNIQQKTQKMPQFVKCINYTWVVNNFTSEIMMFENFRFIKLGQANG